LGASKTRKVISVAVPAAKQGILTGMILGVARVAGESAPLLFTSAEQSILANGLGEPTASLPVMIYKHAISPFDDYHRQAWAAGLVLLVWS
jgi:phosphate transport system permease protein